MKTKPIRPLAALLLFGSAFAETPSEYAGYVQLADKDTTSRSSWNQAGGWSDGLAPDPSKNYYVAPGGLLMKRVAQHNLGAELCWNGGRLVVGGVFFADIGLGDLNGLFVRDLVLLGGSELRMNAYGPLYPYNGETGTVTVASTADGPATITQNYSQSVPTAGGFRNHALTARFVGTAESHLVYTRPFTNYNGVACDRGYFLRIPEDAFADYPGTFQVTGGNTIAVIQRVAGDTFSCPGMALRVDGGAELRFDYGGQGPAVALRSLSAADAALRFSYNSAPHSLWPLLSVSEALSLGEGTTVRILNSNLKTFASKVSVAGDGTPLSVKVAHLGEGAAERAGDLSKARVLAVNGESEAELPGGLFALRAVDDGAGGKDVYVAMPGYVAMTNVNVETTSGSSIQYGAFEEGHAGDWTNGETPSPDSALDYVATVRLCCFKSIDMPNATLTYANNASWKGGDHIAFREISFLEGVDFGMWGRSTPIRMSAERLTLHGSPSGSPVTFYIGGPQLTVDADLRSDGAGLVIRSFNETPSQRGAISLSHANTNFHGRLTVSQEKSVTKDGADAKYVFRTYLGDARNWGGEYTASEDVHDAITLRNFPRVVVTNDVCFSEPTRGMLVSGGARIEVESGRTLCLSNQVTWAGELEKAGEGVLELAGSARFVDGAAGTAPVAGTNVLRVLEGALRVSSAAAADGLAVTFAAGTRLVVPAGTEYGFRNARWSEPFAVEAADGVLPVEVDLAGAGGAADVEVPICTLGAEAAEATPVGRFRVAKAAGGVRCRSVAKRANADGSVTYVATMGRHGLRLVVR